jgi:hypothetical protein
MCTLVDTAFLYNLLTFLYKKPRSGNFFIALLLGLNLLCYLHEIYFAYVLCLHWIFFCNHRVTAFFLGGVVRNLYIFFNLQVCFLYQF